MTQRALADTIMRLVKSKLSPRPRYGIHVTSHWLVDPAVDVEQLYGESGKVLMACLTKKALRSNVSNF